MINKYEQPVRRSRALREPVPTAVRPLHRIHAVRQREGMSLRGISRKMHVQVRELKVQERTHSDLRLSQLYKWQQALQVPIADLLVESDVPLSGPVLRRARMVKVMKTVMSIQENADSIRVRRMAQMLMEQLIEIMPELEGVSSWPAVGQRRSLEDYGRAADRCTGHELVSAMDDLG